MTAGAKFLLALLATPAIGAGALFAARRRLAGLAALLGTSAAVGIAALSFEMLAFSLLGWKWTLPLLLAPAAIAAVWRMFRKPSPLLAPSLPGRRAALGLAVIALLLAAYAAGTARATSPDLILFWGAKGEQFARARTLDFEFLRRPELYLMHPDYPPGFPFLLAFGTMAAGRFPWGASLLVMPGILAATAAIFKAGAEARLRDAEAASWLTVLFTATVVLTNLVSMTAGNADSALVLFETAALAALLSIRERRLADWSAGFALAAAVLTKLEGVFFTGLVVSGVLIFGGGRWPARLKSAVRILVAPVAAFLTWYALCRAHGLLDMFRGGPFGAFTLRNFWRIPPAMAVSARYDSAYLPWIALLAAAFVFRRFGRAMLPLWTAAGFLAVNVFFYLHGTRDPTEWIGWSAARTLITILVSGFLSIGRARVVDAPGEAEPSSVRARS